MGLVEGLGAEAAPGPVFGAFDKACFDWIAVHVAEFFDSLGFRVDVEVIVARLPDELVGSGAGEALLQDLDGCRKLCLFRLRDEEMDVI